MKITILYSQRDTAGKTIANELPQEGKWGAHDVTVLEISQDSIYYDEVNTLTTDMVIFATRHKAASQNKTLSVHFPGNLGDASFGGEEKKVCMSAPQIAKQLFVALHQLAKNSVYEVTLEATHHGPFCTIPCLFIEIGSTELEWQDQQAGKIIANTLFKGISSLKKDLFPIALGFGGTHYCSNFNKIELQAEIALSHIVPKYAIMQLTTDQIEHLLQMTSGTVDFALLDWKGMNSVEKNHLISLLDEVGLEWKKTQSFTKLQKST